MTSAVALAANHKFGQFAVASRVAEQSADAANWSDPLAYFLRARVPLSFLMDCGKISLSKMLEEPGLEYRIAIRDDDGGFKVGEFPNALAFLEGAHAAGLQPWGAREPGEHPSLTFYNAVPYRNGNVLWFSMDGCTNLEDDSWVPLCLPPAELKRALANERRRKARQRKKVALEKATARAAALERISASMQTRRFADSAVAAVTH